MSETTKPKRAASAYDEPTPEKIAFGKRMREAREIAGMSQAEAAEAMGYSQAVQLSLMESGQRMPTVRVLIHCCTLYGTTMDFLCGLVEDSDRDPALAMQRYLTAIVEARLKQIMSTMVTASVDAARVLPSIDQCARLASTAIEAASALDAFRQRNPKFDDMRGSATLAAKMDAARTLSLQFAADMDRARRITSVRDMRGARARMEGDPTGDQLSLLPALDLIGAAK